MNPCIISQKVFRKMQWMVLLYCSAATQQRSVFAARVWEAHPSHWMKKARVQSGHDHNHSVILVTAENESSLCPADLQGQITQMHFPDLQH